MDLHIDDFHKDVATALLKLYQGFPRKTTLYVADLIGFEEPDEFGLPSPRHQSCFGALLWLGEEGYLRFESTIGYQALDQAVLSEKGFLRLSRKIPVSPQETELPTSVRRVRETLAWQLREALAQRDTERLVQLTRLVFERDHKALGDIV